MIKKFNDKQNACNYIIKDPPEAFWPLYPLGPSARSFFRERGPIAGIETPGEIVNQFPFDQAEPESYYMPTKAEILVIKEHYPGSAVITPPWHLIKAELIRNGEDHRYFGDLTAPAVVTLFIRQFEKPPLCSSKEGTVNQKMINQLHKNDKLYTLTCQQWAHLIGCSKQAVAKTKAWKIILQIREENKKGLVARGANI